MINRYPQGDEKQIKESKMLNCHSVQALERSGFRMRIKFLDVRTPGTIVLARRSPVESMSTAA
jgi:hypothetical protein